MAKGLWDRLEDGEPLTSKHIGALFRDLRHEAGMTQKQVAEVLRISNQTVSAWETGKNDITLYNAIRLLVIYQ